MKMIVVHCSATGPDHDIGAYEIDEWHRKRGFTSIGYNYVIRRDGRVEAGRPEGEELSHAKGFNKSAIAVCVVGGVSTTGAPVANFTTKQWRSLRVFVEWMKLKYQQADLLGHRDLPGVLKDCPCFDVGRWWETGEIRDPRKVV